MQPIGIIGLGLLGSAISDRLVAAGYQVIGFDLKPERNNLLVQSGGTVASDPRAVFSRCNRVFLSLFHSQQVRTLLAAELEGIQSDSIILDTTTGSPDDAVAVSQVVADKGAFYLDTTIAGSSEQIRSREAIAMIGGDARAIANCQDLLDGLFPRYFCLGPSGSAARMKLIVNLVLGLNRAVLAEGLTLAKRSGVDPRAALEVLMASPAHSGVMSTKGNKMIESDFSLQARLSQHHKDVKLILELAQDADAYVPLLQLHDRLLDRAMSMGLADMDNSAVVRVFESQSFGQD